MLSELDKRMIDWSICQLKIHKAPIEKFIENLKKGKNQEITDYAISVSDSINILFIYNYEKELQQEAVKTCMESENPKETARNFFKAINVDPRKTELGIKIMNSINSKRE